MANSISGMAQGISMIAIPWYFATRDETAMFGVIYAVITCVSLFWGPLGGTWVDRYDRRKIFLALTTVSGVMLLAVSAYGFLNGSLPWFVVAGVFLMTFMNYNIHYPNLYSFIQEISEPGNYGKLASYIEIQGQATSVLAGGCAAILLEGTTGAPFSVLGFEFAFPYVIEPWPIHQIFLLDGSTYVVAFFLILAIKYVPLVKRKLEVGSPWSRLKTGVRFLWSRHNTLIFGITSTTFFATLLVEAFYLAALYVDQHLNEGAHVYALGEIAYSVGAILSGFAIRWVFKKVNIPATVIFMSIAGAGCWFVLAGFQSALVFYLTSVVIGLVNAGVRIQRVTYIMQHIPNQFLGRSNSVYFVINILQRITMLLLFALPWFHDNGRIIWTFVIMGCVMMVAISVMLLYYKRFQTPPHDHEALVEQWTK